MGCATSYEGSSKELPENAYCKSSSKPNGTVIEGRPDMSDEHFSQHQKRILRETWTMLGEDKHNLGVAIFVLIFKRKPQTKKLFPFADLEGDELMNNPMFRSHSKRFINAIDTTIQNLDDLEVALIPVLHRLGENHAFIPGLKEEYLDLFMGSILDVVADALSKKCTNQERDAWGHLGNFIAEKMHEGYQSAQMGITNVSIQEHKDLKTAPNDNVESVSCINVSQVNVEDATNDCVAE